MDVTTTPMASVLRVTRAACYGAGGVALFLRDPLNAFGRLKRYQWAAIQRARNRGMRNPRQARDVFNGDGHDSNNTMLANLSIAQFCWQRSRLTVGRAIRRHARQQAILDAHNCYPYEGKWADRIERALSTGTPVSIEQDIAWYQGRVVVSHTPKTNGSEPLLTDYFFRTGAADY
jgi:hypothetical protein